MKKYTRDAAETALNEIEVPEDDKKSNGGRIPDTVRYGSWLRRNDPVAFAVYFQERSREIEFAQ